MAEADSFVGSGDAVASLEFTSVSVARGVWLSVVAVISGFVAVAKVVDPTTAALPSSVSSSRTFSSDYIK